MLWAESTSPGWDCHARKREEFTDVRDQQKQLKAAGIKLTIAADASTTGPASFTTRDLDGNPILVDQQV